ncbi:MAG: universal stress protein [Candidatus Aquicultorales bacterium]
MFDKILVPIELTEFDELVLKFVGGLSRYGIKEVVLAHVAALKGVERPVAMKQEQRYSEEMETRSALLEGSGVEVRTVLASGVPHDEILKITEADGISLIVTGTRGKGAFNELAVGSVSETIGRKATVPVMMIPYRSLSSIAGDEVFEMGRNVFSKVLYPTDFSDIAERTLEFIRTLDCQQLGELIVAHVVEARELRPEHKDAVLRSTKRIMTAIKDELSECGFNARVEMVIGPVVAELLQLSEETGTTAYVLGSHGRGIGEELFIGSVSQNIIRMSRKPVIITH